MTDPKAALGASQGAAPEAPDGRRLRSERSRTQIIDAMFEILREGDYSPSAAKVAERGKVGLRTVFRHFEDMDSLYVEMAERTIAEVMPKILAPLEAEDWHGRLFEHLGRRIEIYEYLFPVRVAANLRRFQSRFLMEEYRRNLAIERAALKALLPDEITTDPVRFASIESAAGFQTWRTLRQDYELSLEDAARAFRLALERLVSP